MQTRNTVQRQIVLQAVLRMHDHPTADRVYEAVVAEHPSISKATVYRNLNQLASQGEIRRVSMPNGADRFDFRKDEHFHVRCSVCGAVYDVHMPQLDDLIERIDDAEGVEVQRYDILFEGVCAQCRGK
ncbi:MAG: transcriptional repressor [Agathobaculum sp.]|uniref:Fur family transcriptional regulator n=1 Tax=Agathobaculum sp. TaxID=2048138 RepID=UPI0025C1A58F|nr:transcriptional repressor [Agathobaculum sp.]MCI7126632.1 transcriptional repressor [Agathobaculum sp.]MDY3711304.1 transcriptional repressor [Agathobaculum sp.]